MEPVTINVDDIGGTAEVAAALGCPKQQIHALRRNPKFPQPVKVLASTPLWNLQQIVEFRASWVRRKKED